MVGPRIVKRSTRPRMRNSALLTNLAIAVVSVAMALLIGWWQYLLILTLMVLFAGGAGVWLFFVQHQFEDTYWESGEQWSYADAALRGSSYLKLPQPLKFFSGNIGLHHVHHLGARAELQAAGRARRAAGLPRRAGADTVGRVEGAATEAVGRGEQQNRHVPRGAAPCAAAAPRP